MIDPEKIFNLFSQIGDGKTSPKMVEQLIKAQDSPAFKLGMFQKMIFNHLEFNDSLISLVKRVDEDFDINDVKNASEYIVYVRAWEYIADFNLKDIESFEILKKYSSQELHTSFKLSIHFFQELEEYEKCSHLHKIEKAIQFFLV